MGLGSNSGVVADAVWEAHTGRMGRRMRDSHVGSKMRAFVCMRVLITAVLHCPFSLSAVRRAGRTE